MGDADAGAFDTELVIGEGEAVVDALFAELRVLDATGKEVLERFAQLNDRHLRCRLCDLQHPWKLLALDGVQLTTQCSLRGLGHAVVLLPCRILALPFGQRPVVGETRRACRTGKISRLPVVGCKRNPVGTDHVASSTTFFTPSSSFWFLRERLP